ncbi:MAG TPA: hypothetical protein VFF14_01435 [Candidatus Deferrimicrobium sp.]|nr:hypothetical protein [Candidatus Deferrimicrobium sp.]
MFYRVEYTNPNNICLVGKIYTFETRSKAELDAFLERAACYSGSYNIISVEKISEAKRR